MTDVVEDFVDVSTCDRAAGVDPSPVFERLGNIVRALHDALTEIGAQRVIADAASEFPSARERLLHIARLTENAANIVLGKVEENGPVLDHLAAKAAALQGAWRILPVPGDGTLPPPELVADTQRFLAEVESGCSTSRAALSDIMMAQDFQDLTGQLIKKVVTLMERTETDLLALLVEAAPPGLTVQVPRDELTAGPGAHGSGGTALEQANVDDLLAELGF